MTDCAFKIGETYSDREGTEWVLVARNDEYHYPLVFREKKLGNVQPRHIDGKLNEFQTHKLDILPNPKREWVVTYKIVGEDKIVVKDSELAAKEHVRLLGIDNDKSKGYDLPPIYTEIRGPFPWEDKA